MNSATFPGAAGIVNLLPLASINSTRNGAGVDITRYRGHALALLDAAAPSSGTNPTLAVKIQHTPEASKITSITPSGTGNGKIQAEAGPDPVAETITISFTSATDFTVTGTVTGSMAAGTVGTAYTSAQLNFLILAGSTPFESGDTFAIVTTARTWADLVSFTGLTTALKRETKVVNVDTTGRYIRAVATLGGTSSPAYTASLNLLMVED